MNTYEDYTAAIEGCAASLKDERPQIAATLRFALQGIQEHVSRLQLQKENAEEFARMQLQGGAAKLSYIRSEMI